eukprot:GEMP01022403.1.p1 GENE.GEMP01022403.1~~GEMP01022403.1.p1  ORF type:complete len:592 (+),score=85.72 GEMP01022403.1:367-2142(+)
MGLPCLATETESKLDETTPLVFEKNLNDIPLADSVVVQSWNPVTHIAHLKKIFGADLLVALWSAQHLIKGMGGSMIDSSDTYLYKSYHVVGPQLQIYRGFCAIPWTMKPLMGLISDFVPIGGYSKAPYMLLAACVGVYSAAMIGFVPHDYLGIHVVVMLIFFLQCERSVIDLLTEAKYSEAIKAHPTHGPNLMAYVAIGMAAFSILAVTISGLVITHVGPKAVFCLLIPIIGSIIVPVTRNMLNERPQDPETVARRRERLAGQIECVYLAVLLFAASCTCVILGLVDVSASRRALGGAFIFIVAMVSLAVSLRPDIAKISCYFLLQSCLFFPIEGAAFYFFTDSQTEYFEGPNFSPSFYVTGYGIVSSVCSIIGLIYFQNNMKNMKYRTIIFFTNIALCLLGCSDMIIFSRKNIQWGIPDYVLCLGVTVFGTVIQEWNTMTCFLIMCHMCPSGMEATIFSLTAGAGNLGRVLASFFSAYMLELLSVQPMGVPNESRQFDNLWMAAGVHALLPCLPIVLIPFFFPDKNVSDHLDTVGQEATEGSIIRTYFWKPAGTNNGRGNPEHVDPRDLVDPPDNEDSGAHDLLWTRASG